MNHAYLHWDVFTGEPLLGNQLAVFTSAAGIDTLTMQRMAREMNFSESTFLMPAEQPGTDVRMRIFTPLQEMPMAGHPTIGSTFALAHSGFLEPEQSRVVFGLNVGPTPVDLEWAGRQLRFAWMTQGLPVFGKAVDSRSLVASTLGLTLADLRKVNYVVLGGENAGERHDESRTIRKHLRPLRQLIAGIGVPAGVDERHGVATQRRRLPRGPVGAAQQPVVVGHPELPTVVDGHRMGMGDG